MKLIVCLDDRDGMLFSGRRLSRDVAVCKKILELANGHALWMNSYSEKLFAELNALVYVDEDFLENAGVGDFCFAEMDVTSICWSKVEGIVVFRWNRHYPSDVKFPTALLKKEWQLVETDTFSGRSHEKITMEVYAP